MSTFCGGTGGVPSLTTTELRDTYSNGVLPASLPAMANGLAEESYITEYVSNLDQQGRIPKPPQAKDTNSNMFDAPETKDPLAVFAEKEREFQDKLKEEYCFYERRYFSALDSFLQSISNASFRGQPENVSAKLDLARILNQKVTLFTQVVNGIAKFRYARNAQFQNDINSINQTLKQRQVKLVQQADILNRETAAADLHKQMVEYTVEKNKANQNLLTVFGVLNIIAFALVFYVAQS